MFVTGRYVLGSGLSSGICEFESSILEEELS